MITEELIDLVLQLKAVADARMDRTLNAVNASWAAAWDEMADEWQEAIEELSAVAHAEGQWPSRATVTRSMRAQKALDAAQAAMQELSRDLPGTVAEDLGDIVQMARAHQESLIKGQLPQDPGLVDIRRDYDARALASTINRSTQQITALSWPLSEEATAAMKSAIIRGVAIGENPRDTARAMLKKVNGQFEGGRRRAENIARTEMMDAFRASAKQRDEELSHLLKGWEWRSALNDRTCIACLGMNGREFPLDEPGPLGHPSCRCTRVPVTKTWAELGFDVKEPVNPNAPPTGPEWLEQQPEAVQRQIMGKKRYEAWKAGEFPPEQWAVRRENPAWRPSYGVGDPGVPALAPVVPEFMDESVFKENWAEVEIGGKSARTENPDSVDRLLRENMTPREIEALQKYSSGEYFFDIRDAYKGGEQYLLDDGTSLFSSLDSAMEKSSLKNHTALYRSMQVDKSWLSDLAPGSVIDNTFYVSTTSDNAQARSYGKTKKRGQKPVLLEILAPAGTKGVPGMTSIKEVVLPPGTKMRVRRTTELPKFTLVIVDLV